MNGWMGELLFFVELLLLHWAASPRWGTSSLSYFFPGQPLIWATCALSCLPYSSFVFFCSFCNPIHTQLLSLCSCYNAFGSLRLQSRKAQDAMVKTYLTASQWIDQRSRSADNGDDSTLKSNSRYSPVQILPASSSNSAPRPSVVFNILKWKSSSRHNPVHLFQQLSQMEARNRGNRDPIRRPREPLYWKKTHVSRRKMFSPVNSHASDLLHAPKWLIWWCGCNDETWTWWQDRPCTLVRDSEVFELNFPCLPLII